MFPKPKRIRDKKAIERARKPYCEWCGRSDLPIHVHHLRTKSSGGYDSEENLISLCYIHHQMVHNGKISKEELRRKKRETDLFLLG